MFRRTSVLLLTMVAAGFLIGCGSTTPAGPDNSTPAGRDPSSGDLVIIAITGMDGDRAFDPAVATLKVGQSVAWKNNDTRTHRPILTDVFDTKQLAGGATSAPTRMTTADTYEYKCTIHPTETGTVVVRP